jgi:GrpB-like predicted nucleotidyltransferase (UPF0157 family)
LDRLAIVPYDSRWPAAFAEQSERVAGALAAYLVGPVEHIGSTSVPGLPAKPIIDMLARVRAYTVDIVPALAGIGWVHAPEPGDAAERKLSFCYPDAAYRSHHLHVVEHGSAGWPTWLAFRDHLRAHPADAAAYGALKAELAQADDTDRPKYRAGKAPFIEAVLSAARSPSPRPPTPAAPE